MNAAQPEMDATVVVCTFNRAASLRDTLAALRKLQAPVGCDWEVVVVDNNSRDGTREMVEAARREWPRLRYEFEPAQGLSHARNRGIACAKGEILLFTDDDVLPEPDWLATTLGGMDRYGAQACGGYIAPIWETPPPAWLTERFHGFLAIRTDRRDDFLMGEADEPPFGANMAFRRGVFDLVGHFDTARGRKGNVLASGEDGEMFARVRAAGLTVAFLGSSRVHHKVESFRVTKRYFRRWRFQTSANIAKTQGMIGDRRLLNVPLYVYPQLLRALLRAAWGRVALPRDEAFNREIVLFHYLGLIRGLVGSS